MRGLVTAGRAVRLERFCWSRKSSVASGVNPVAAHSRNADRSSRGRLLIVMVRLFVGVCPAVSVVHDGQGPAPAGQLAGDRDVGDHGSLLAVAEMQPSLV